MKQLLNIAIGLVLMVVVSLLDYRQLRLYAPVRVRRVPASGCSSC